MTCLPVTVSSVINMMSLPVGGVEVCVGGEAPQLPWEPPGKPALLTGGSVTVDPWWERRAPAPSSQGRTSFDRGTNSWDTRTFVLRKKKLYLRRNSHLFEAIPP